MCGVGRKLSSKGYDVKGVHYNTLEEVSKAFDLSISKLTKVFEKYRDMEFAVEYIKTNMTKRVNRSHNRVYKMRGETFRNLSDVAKYLKLNYSDFKDLASRCKTLDELADKVDNMRENRGYIVDGVRYKSINEIERAYDIPHKRLYKAYKRLKNIEKALVYVLTNDYKKKIKFSLYKKKHLGIDMRLAYSTVNHMCVTSARRVTSLL